VGTFLEQNAESNTIRLGGAIEIASAAELTSVLKAAHLDPWFKWTTTAY